MTVNASAGLGISAPRDAGSSTGGKALFIIRDQASFRVEQQLALGSGTRATASDGTLQVIGPNAKITIAGNLNMAVDPDGNVVGLDADTEGDGSAVLGELHGVRQQVHRHPLELGAVAEHGHGHGPAGTPQPTPRSSRARRAASRARVRTSWDAREPLAKSRPGMA